MSEPEFTHADGTVRKDHYGSGRQPWDDIVALGWAPEFAAANVLKYLRRTKDQEDSVKKASWYYNRLLQMRTQRAIFVITTLIHELTVEEFYSLNIE